LLGTVPDGVLPEEGEGREERERRFAPLSVGLFYWPSPATNCEGIVTKSHFTTTELGEHFGIPYWKARRVADALGASVLRVGLYRAVPAALLGRFERELRRRGWLPETAGVSRDA
jgi:hypothetical protein